MLRQAVTLAGAEGGKGILPCYEPQKPSGRSFKRQACEQHATKAKRQFLQAKGM